jgi:serralysin
MTVEPDAYEQLTLELINLARRDPDGEYGRYVTNATPAVASALQYFNVDLNVLYGQLAALQPAAPLAWSNALSNAATRHSQAMIAADQQGHVLADGVTPGMRAQQAGYNFSRLAENVFAYGEDPIYTHAAFMIDWGFTPTGIQDGAGHRMNIMNPAFVHVGIGVVAEANPGTQVGPNVITQNFGAPQQPVNYLVGVAINDLDNDDFYDIGEGLGGVSIVASGTAGTFSTTSWASGGYQLELPNGTYTVQYSGSSVNRTETVTINNQNVKVDVERTVSLNDTFISTAANETFDGAGGLDTVVFSGARSAFAVDLTGATVRVSGPAAGSDELRSIERLQFSDGILALDIEGNAGQAYRLYQAAFERTPDNEGLEYWIGRLDSDTTTLVDIADSFIHSPEFVNTYGTEQTVTNSEFVELLYLHALDRQPDGEGFDYWVDKLDAGTTNRRDLLAFFSESNENKAQVASEIGDGIWLS